MQTTKRIIAVIMTVFMLISLIPANVFAVVDKSNPIELPKTEYAVGEAVIPEVYPQDKTSNSWIGLYLKGDPTNGSVPSIWWDYTCYVDEDDDFSKSQSKYEIGLDRSDLDTYVSEGSLLPGSYKLVYYDDYPKGSYAYNVLGTAEFSVAGDVETPENPENPETPETPETPAEVDTYCVGKPVYYTPTTDKAIEWYGLYKASVTPAGSTSNAWAYPSVWDSCDKNISSYDTWSSIDNNADADVNDDSVFYYQSADGKWHLSAGEYKFVCFGDGGYDNHAEIYYFNVVEHDFTKETAVDKKASFTENGVINSVCACGDSEFKSEIVKASANLEYNSVQSDGSEKKPAVTVLDGKGNEISAEDYVVVYANNVNPGVATATVTLNNAEYEGEIVLNFTITEAEHVCEYNIPFVEPATFDADGRKGMKCSCTRVNEESVEIIEAVVVSLEYDEVSFDGNEKVPTIIVVSGNENLLEDTDYEVVFSNNTNPGTATVKVTLKGDNYSGENEYTFKIKSMSVEKTTFCKDEDIVVTAHTIASEKDWVSVYVKGETNDAGYLYYYYLDSENSGKPYVLQNGKKGGGHTLDYLPAGSYTLKLLLDDGYEVAESIDITIANHTTETVPGKEATCEEDGLTDGKKCTACGKVLVEQEVIPAGHKYVGTETTAATCEEAGVMTYVCENDASHTYTEEIAPLGHKYVGSETTAATCEEAGVMTYVCENDASHTYTEEIAPLGHKYVGTETTPATCEEAGVMTYVCENDASHTYTEEIAPLGHKYVGTETTAATCEEAGVMTYVCENDASHTYTEEIPVLEHTEETIPAKDPTCTETGLTEGKKCSVCDKVLVAQNVVDAKGHDYKSVVTAPTCTTEGFTTYTCSCGDSYVSDTVAPLGHNWVVAEGKKTCTVCKAEEELPTEPTTKPSVEDTTEPSVEDTTKPSVEDTTKPSVEDTTKPSVEDTTKPSVEDTTKPSVEDTTKPSVEDTTKPSEEPTTKPSDEPTTKPHEHTEEIIPAVTATCTTPGKTEGKKCSECGEILLAQKDVAAFGHADPVDVKGKDSTCTETGLTAGKKCPVCNVFVVEQTIIPALGHKVEVVPGKAATCTEAGISDGKKCADCGIVIEAQTEIPATGHTEKVIPAKEATYTASGLTEGKQCSVCGKVTLAQKKVSRKKLKKVSSLNVKKYTSTSVTLSWKSVTGADSYKVYYSTDGKKWKSVKVKKNTATIKKLKSGTQYRFKVRAFAGKYYGTASKVVKKTTKVKKATLSSVKSLKKSQATVNWKKVTNANGYVVEYSTSKKFTKKTTKKVTIKKGKTVKTTLKKLKSGKKYYVRVKAYKTVNKKAVYGAVSSVKTVKVK